MSQQKGATPDRATAQQPPSLFAVTCDRPLLVATFDRPQAVLSWAMTRPGFRTTGSVAWLEVREADLPIGGDPFALLETRMAAAGLTQAVAMMTSRDVRRHHVRDASSGGVRASCLATVGLANSGRVGSAPSPALAFGTINALAAVSRPLCDAALVEAISIAAEARTAAVMDLGWRRDGRIVTGTGTDCLVVAAPVEDGGEAFAGLHTDVGAAIGAAVYGAVTDGGRRWIAERNEPSGSA